MVNLKEGAYLNIYFDFMGSAVDRSMLHPEAGLVRPRTLVDYTSERSFLPPPNFLRSLLAEDSLKNLREGFNLVDRNYPGRFEQFDIHLRGAYTDSGEKRGELVLPWDVLTKVTFDKRQMYTPVNVSFSHQVMTTKWDDDPVTNFMIKREIVERQIADVTRHSFPGIDIALYGVAIPEKFAYGATNRIFTEYPSFFADKTEVHELYRGERVVHEGSIYYFFPGKGIKREEFNSMIQDPAFMFFNAEINNRWGQNFRGLINQPSQDGPDYYDETRFRILRCLGASPEPVGGILEENVHCR